MIPTSRATVLLRWLHWRSWRFLQLLLFMVVVLLLNPLQPTHPLLMLTLDVMLLNGFMVSLSAAGFAPRMRWLFFAIWLVYLALEASARNVDGPGLATSLGFASHLLIMVLMVGCVIATLRYVLLSQQVTTDSICASVVAYLFIGMAFASAYYCFVVLDAKSFSMPSELAVSRGHGLDTTMIYYSYVTLATLGYGDITPRLPLPQIVAALEAIIGQFYIAVVIAWLVSVYAATRSAVVQRGSGNDG